MKTKRKIKKKEKSEDKPSSKLINLFSTSLEKFRNSSRYTLLAPLPIVQFLSAKNPDLHTLAEITLADLSQKLLEDSRVSSDTISELSNSLRELAAGPEVGATEENLIQVTPELIESQLLQAKVKPDLILLSQKKPKGPAFSSTKAELELVALISELKSSPNFTQVAGKTLADFWIDNTAPAPFEQSLTLSQFVSMKPENIIKKRSFSALKLSALLGACRACLGLISESQTSSVDNTRTREFETILESPSSSPISSPVTGPVGWTISQLPPKLPTYLRHAVDYCALVASNIVGSKVIARICKRLPLVLSDLEYLVCLLVLEKPHSQVVMELGLKVSQIEAIKAQADSKLKDLMKKEFPETYSFWQTNLLGPGILKEQLLSLCIDTTQFVDFQNCLADILLSAFNAKVPLAYGQEFAQYLSANPQALELTVKQIKASSSKAQALELATVLLPHFDSNLILEKFFKSKAK